MKLYYSKNLNPRVAVAVARHLEAPIEYVRASPRAPGNAAAFAPINPNALVPVLVEDGAGLWETDAIACRLAMLRQPSFWPQGDAAPRLQQWISWSNNHFIRAASVFYWEYVIKPSFDASGVDEGAIAEASGDFHRYARVLDDALADREWLVGDALSYADFRAATALPFAEAARMPVADYRNIQRWHAALWALPAWRDPFEGLD